MKTLRVGDRFKTSSYSHSDPVNNAIRKYKNHPSVKKINETITITSTFHFSNVDKADVEKANANLNSSKVGSFKIILTRWFKVTSDICKQFPAANWNGELADITPVYVYKKEDSAIVKSYRPISVLPIVAKLFEQSIQKQISEYINYFLSLFLWGYRKGFSTQTARKKWEHQLDKNCFVGVVLIDLFKTFGTISYDLLTAKLQAYSSGKNVSDLVYCYLKNRKQKVKINTVLVLGLVKLVMYHKDKYWVFYYNIYLMIFSFSFKK